MHGRRDRGIESSAGDTNPADIRQGNLKLRRLIKRFDQIMAANQSGRMTDIPEERNHPRRLRRLDEVWTTRGRPVFFVTICTADRRPWLERPEIHNAFVAFCAQSPEKAGAWVGQYVLMPDHVHLFVSVEGSQALSRWVGALKRHLAKVRRETGPKPPGA